MSCPECGGTLKSETRGSSRITSCANCGWSVVTSYIDPIYEDVNEYAVHLGDGNDADKATLSAVSKVCNCNYLAARKMLDAPNPVLFSGNAADTTEVISLLKEHGVSFFVQPDWPY